MGMHYCSHTHNDGTRCKYSSKHKAKVTRHQNTHLDYADRPYPCTVEGCKFRSATSQGLKQHVVTHRLNEEDIAALAVQKERSVTCNRKRKAAQASKQLKKLSVYDASLTSLIDKRLQDLEHVHGAGATLTALIPCSRKDGEANRKAKIITKELADAASTAGYDVLTNPMATFVKALYDGNAGKAGIMLGIRTRLGLTVAELDFIKEKKRFCTPELMSELRKPKNTVTRWIKEYHGVIADYVGVSFEVLQENGKEHAAKMFRNASA